MSTHDSSPASATPRKAMRKGTHSCLECRRRKLCCIFKPDDPGVCTSCRNRGSQCTAQRRDLVQTAVLGSRLSLKERVAQLEAIVQSLTAGDVDASSPRTGTGPVQLSESTLTDLDETIPTVLHTTGSITHQVNEDDIPILPFANSSPDFGADSPQDIDPIVSLFNNVIWQSNAPNGSSFRDRANVKTSADNLAPELAAKHMRTRKALLSDLPSPELLRDIITATSSWWYSWRPLGPYLPDSMAICKLDTLQEFVVWAATAVDPVIVGLGMLCISVSIQQLNSKTHEDIIRRLPHLPGRLFHKIFARVDSLIINDSDYASTRNGIEVIAMSAQMLMNLGLIKKTWILNNRAISYAQLLGLHRPYDLLKKEPDVNRDQRHWSWISLCESNTYLGLVTGLPCTADCRTIPISIYGESWTTPFFRHKLLLLSNQVIDRNQMGLNLSTDLTNRIQEEIEAAANFMHKDFWHSPTIFANGTHSKEEYFQWITSHLWFHQLRVSLHMPLMIQSLEVPELRNHRLACLEACRDLLKTYNIMRSDSHSAFNMVKVIDYQAFVCAALLLLGVLGYANSPLLDQTMDRIKDRQLVDVTTNIIRQTAATSNNSVASQALQGLETLISLSSANGCSNMPAHDQCATPFATVVVPYCGTIILSPGIFLKNRKSSQQGLQPSTTIPTHVFRLSRGAFQLLPGEIQTQHNVEASGDGYGSFDNATGGFADETGVGSEFPSINFDWASAISMNAEEDWAWLNDATITG